MNTETYAIHNSQNGQLIGKFELDANEVESVSCENEEGHFDPRRVTGLESIEVASVYALVA